eukprot:scaffold1684_cov214-Amphora_coffeaeformis.AAC.10
MTNELEQHQHQHQHSPANDVMDRTRPNIRQSLAFVESLLQQEAMSTGSSSTGTSCDDISDDDSNDEDCEEDDSFYEDDEDDDDDDDNDDDDDDDDEDVQPPRPLPRQPQSPVKASVKAPAPTQARGAVGVVQQLQKMMESQSFVSQQMDTEHASSSLKLQDDRDDLDDDNEDDGDDDWDNATFSSDCRSIRDDLSNTEMGVKKQTRRHIIKNTRQHPLKIQLDEAGNLDIVGETKDVTRCRRILYMVLVCTALMGSLVARFWVDEYHHSSSDYRYETLVHLQASEIAESIEMALAASFALLRTLSKTITTDSVGVTFPYYTIPYFAEQTSEVLSTPGMVSLAYVPLVAKEDLPEWDTYTKTQRNIGPVSFTNRPNLEGVPNLKDYYLPIWQEVPFQADYTVSRDALAGDDGGLEHVTADVWSTGRAQLSPLDHTTASSYVVQPILNDIGTEENVVVGFFLAVLDWQAVLQRALYLQGFYVVLRDGCGATKMTLGLDESDRVVQYPDVPNDSISGKYGHTLDIATDLRYSGESHESVQEVAFDERWKDSRYGHCGYSVEVYPSSSVLEEHIGFWDSARLSWTLSLALVIILALLFCYDFVASRRQHKLEDAAARTHAIVSGIFPKNVQERMLSAEENGKNITGVSSINHDSSEVPIADLFPETTIMFADIAGFTAWSSTREPCQIAQQERVFKVETIGDCYVAVCGTLILYLSSLTNLLCPYPISEVAHFFVSSTSTQVCRNRAETMQLSWLDLR